MADGFVADLLRCARDEATRRDLADLLRKWAGCRVYMPVQRDTRPLDAARSLRSAGTSRADAARILAARFSLSYRHCRRVVRRVYGPPDT